jgi:hypothetical protein
MIAVEYPIQIMTDIMVGHKGGQLLRVSFWRKDEPLGSMCMSPKRFTSGSRFRMFTDYFGKWTIYDNNDVMLLEFGKNKENTVGFEVFGAREVWGELQKMGFEVV